ncbi:MAG: RNA 2',3'-cyclic phosphodiesterase [Candidatus Aminicenantales bacterium]
MRTFIAIDLDEALKNSLAAFVDELRPLAGNVRWVGASGMHLTLKFLGEIPEADATGISSALEEICRRQRPFPLVLQGTGAFPPGRRNPRVFWVGAVPVPALAALQEEIEREMGKRGFERENRPYRPHLTLGRVRFPAPLDPLILELERHKERLFGEMNVQRLVFFRSLLKPSGAEYTILKELDLG